MKRREFFKAMSALGLTTLAPSIFTDRSFIEAAQASPAISEVTVDLTGKRTPQVINIFLYGGASELAGNLTNIHDLNPASQSKYTELNPRFLFNYASDLSTVTAQELAQGIVGQVTPNAFWAHAGGIIMEDLLNEGDMTIYRTCNRRKNNTRAHRPSIFSGQKGTLDIDDAPGLGTTLASVMVASPENRSKYEAAFGKPLEELLMPMVSFEGESTTFAPDPNATIPIPLVLKPVGLSANFDNPYRRQSEPLEVATIDDLVDSKMRANPGITDPQATGYDELKDYGKRYKKVSESFISARKLAGIVQGYQDLINDPDALPLLPENDPDGSNPDFDINLFDRFLLALNGEGYTGDHQDPPQPLSPFGNGLNVQWLDRTETDPVTGLQVLVINPGTGLPYRDMYYLDFNNLPITNPDGTPIANIADMENDPRFVGGPGNNRLVYPPDNRFAELLKAAVTLCIHNPDTKLAMVGSPGLGGWDDHNSAMTSYEARMQTLMSAVRAAVKHIKYSAVDPMITSSRGGDTSNIIINIFTDFGRNANLNTSKGWDHGNNQNFYTFGGRPYILDPDWTAANVWDTVQPVKNADLTSEALNYVSSIVPSPRPDGALGKIVGTTNIFGTAGQNRLFTKPSELTDLNGTGGTLNAQNGVAIPSYEFEPQAIASTIYHWFGVVDPEKLTQNDDPEFSSGTVDYMGSDGNGGLQPKTLVNRSSGEPPIDERVEGFPLAYPPLSVKNIIT